MKAIEFIKEEQLGEVGLRQTIAAADLAGALALPGASVSHSISQPVSPQTSYQQALKLHMTPQIVSPRSTVPDLAQIIIDKYSVHSKLAVKCASAAKRYEYSTFPKAEDILAITGIESSFDPSSISGLSQDPARGLMQVRPGKWKLSPKSLSTIDKQIKVGAKILNHYYRKLGSIPAAVHAYNIGITNFRHGKNLNPEYVQKFTNERKLYQM
jgi:hypothetical protein